MAWWEALNRLPPQEGNVYPVCSKCRVRPAKSGTCQHCKNRRAERAAEAAERGDCQTCFYRPATEGLTTCPKCRESKNKSRKKSEKAKRDAAESRVPADV